jgi:16S rRNA (guanine527-N7)-methyltransferase
LESKQKKLLEDYETFLISWNRTHNLISKSQTTFLKEHIQDSLAISSKLQSCLVDLGSGGGLPGIPIAIANPEKTVILVESNTKKSSFLLNATGRLGLKNTQVINERIEKIDPSTLPEQFDVVSRAVGSIKTNINLVSDLLKNKRIELKLMKTEDQLDQEKIPPGYIIKKIDKFPSKTKDKTRILVTIETEQQNG